MGMRKEIIPMVVRGDSELLARAPHRRMLDVGIVYVCPKISESHYTTSLVDFKMAELLNLSEKELYEISLQNLQRDYPYFCEDICSVVSGFERYLDEELPSFPSLMFVITNKNVLFGASYLLMPDILKSVCDEHFDGEDLYVFPSSVNELLVMRKSLCPVEYAKEMILAGNEHCDASKHEVISEHVYFYNRSLEKLDIAC